MRKKYLPFIAIAIMTFFVACSNEELLPEAIGEAEANTETTIEETRTLSITATMPGDEDPKTRVTLERDGGLGIILKWQAGDRLQFAFVQGETKVKHVLTLKAEDNITNDGKTVNFNIALPDDSTGFDSSAPFDLYGLYSNYRDTDDGLPNGLSETNPTNVILTRTPGSMGTLTNVQNRGDVMLYFESKNIDPVNPIATVNFKHLGSLFAITFNNVVAPAASAVTQARLVGVDEDGGPLTDGNWAYNNDDGGQIFDLTAGVAGKFLNPESAGNFISFSTAGRSWTVGTTTTLWGWYPPLPNKEWPALRLQMTNNAGDPIISSVNFKPARTAPTPAGRAYHFYAEWNGTDLIFTNDDFTTPSPALTTD